VVTTKGADVWGRWWRQIPGSRRGCWKCVGSWNRGGGRGEQRGEGREGGETENKAKKKDSKKTGGEERGPVYRNVKIWRNEKSRKVRRVKRGVIKKGKDKGGGIGSMPKWEKKESQRSNPKQGRKKKGTETRQKRNAMGGDNTMAYGKIKQEGIKK